MRVAPLDPALLRQTVDPARIPFDTTDTAEEFPGILGQPRAVEAIRFAVGMESDGYNLFAMGPEGIGRHSLVRRFLEERAPHRVTPPDWCYVFDFDRPDQPRAMAFPPGGAAKFRDDMARLVEDLRIGIPAAFETEDFRNRLQEVESALEEGQENAVSRVGDLARERGIALVRTPNGFGFAPRSGDEVMAPEEFKALPEARQKELQSVIEELEGELAQAIQDIPKLRREAQRKVRELIRQVTGNIVTSLIAEMKAAYAGQAPVLAYLARLQDDVLDHADTFRQAKEGEGSSLLSPRERDAESPLARYQVNVLVDHAGNGGAPIVSEDNPNHDNLVGRIEHQSQMGALVTNFMLVKAGALHRANGGYLILDALKVLTQPFAWDALKRALRSREIRTESLGQALGLVSTVGLKPEPITLDVKVVLVGDRLIYYLLYAYDPEFSELFKVAADFEEDMPRSPAKDLLYARAIATLARREKLRPLSRSAVARVTEHAIGAAGDRDRLALSLRGLTDLLHEADHFAGIANAALVEPVHVTQSIEARRHRQSRVRDRLHEAMTQGTLLVDTDGERVGQVNGLSVMQLGDFAFGAPSRITARVRQGSGQVVDIERESRLGGPVHTKGVMILTGFLAGRYAPGRPLSLAATLVFEQNYSGVEGDSASAAELCTLLSAISEVPLRQALAMTGSVNQHGDIQAIGGVNEKIEGFFDLCQARGLTGRQGVIIPAANVRHLMLREEVVDAACSGAFSIFAVSTVDEALALLTGQEAGERDVAGRYPDTSVNGRVERRLDAFAEPRVVSSGISPGTAGRRGRSGTHRLV